MSVLVVIPGRSDRKSGPRVVAPLLATLVLLSACQREVEKPAPEIRPVRTVTIEKRAAGSTVAITGTVQAQNEVNQSFRIDGRLVERLVDVGDNVKAGQLIATLDPQIKWGVGAGLWVLTLAYFTFTGRGRGA